MDVENEIRLTHMSTIGDVDRKSRWTQRRKMFIRISSERTRIKLSIFNVSLSENWLQCVPSRGRAIRLICGGAPRPVVLASGASELEVHDLDEQLVVLEVYNESFHGEEVAAE
ncbi:hypothetical protein ACFE04_020793 [Oxalis oulophora]